MSLQEATKIQIVFYFFVLRIVAGECQIHEWLKGNANQSLFINHSIKLLIDAHEQLSEGCAQSCGLLLM